HAKVLKSVKGVCAANVERVVALNAVQNGMQDIVDSCVSLEVYGGGAV
ncbi:hypothetical protein Tco_0824934, partial [Tanacetum coccineum]